MTTGDINKIRKTKKNECLCDLSEKNPVQRVAFFKTNGMSNPEYPSVPLNGHALVFTHRHIQDHLLWCNDKIE